MSTPAHRHPLCSSLNAAGGEPNSSACRRISANHRQYSASLTCVSARDEPRQRRNSSATSSAVVVADTSSDPTVGNPPADSPNTALSSRNGRFTPVPQVHGGSDLQPPVTDWAERRYGPDGGETTTVKLLHRREEEGPDPVTGAHVSRSRHNGSSLSWSAGWLAGLPDCRTSCPSQLSETNNGRRAPPSWEGTLAQGSDIFAPGCRRGPAHRMVGL